MTYTAQQQMDAIMANNETGIGAQRIASVVRLVNSTNGNPRFQIRFHDHEPQRSFNTKPDSSYAPEIQNWIANGGEREVWLNGKNQIVRIAEINVQPADAPISAKRARGHFSGH